MKRPYDIIEGRKLMLTLKDFRLKQKVYILYLHQGSNRSPEITETRVKKVGRKYITVSNYDKRFERRGNVEALSEHCDFGEAGYLFDSYESAETEKKRYILHHNIRAIYLNYLYKCSYEELRTIMDILKEASNR